MQVVLNILRAGVLGANDGIISIAGVVIGVASATSNIWIIFLSGFAAILAGAFSMAGGEYVSVSTQKDTEEAAVAREQVLLDQDMELAKKSLYAAYIQNGECETSAQLLTNKAFLNNPLKALVEEKYGIEYEEFTNPWHAAISSFISFFLGSLPPMLSITISQVNTVSLLPSLSSVWPFFSLVTLVPDLEKHQPKQL